RHPEALHAGAKVINLKEEGRANCSRGGSRRSLLATVECADVVLGDSCDSECSERTLRVGTFPDQTANPNRTASRFGTLVCRDTNFPLLRERGGACKTGLGDEFWGVYSARCWRSES